MEGFEKAVCSSTIKGSNPYHLHYAIMQLANTTVAGDLPPEDSLQGYFLAYG